MPRYLAIHHAPGITVEQFQGNVPEVLAGKYATFVRSYVNLVEGTLINIYEADSEEAVAREFDRIGFPYDEIREVQFEASADDLRKMLP